MCVFLFSHLNSDRPHVDARLTPAPRKNGVKRERVLRSRRSRRARRGARFPDTAESNESRVRKSTPPLGPKSDEDPCLVLGRATTGKVHERERVSISFLKAPDPRVKTVGKCGVGPNSHVDARASSNTAAETHVIDTDPSRPASRTYEPQKNEAREREREKEPPLYLVQDLSVSTRRLSRDSSSSSMSTSRPSRALTTRTPTRSRRRQAESGGDARKKR